MARPALAAIKEKIFVLDFRWNLKKRNLKKIKLPFSPTIALEKKKIAIFCEGQSLLNFEDQNGFINIVSGTGLDEELNLLNEYDWKNIIK